MSRTTRCLSLASNIVVLLAVAGCGGGGGGVSTPAAIVTAAPIPKPTATAVPVVPGVPAAAGSATFTVYTAKVDGQTLVSLAPGGGGAPDAGHAWSIAPGAYVIYPDRSVQVTDASGSFDASKATWTVTNTPLVAGNPNASPELRITVPGSVTPAVPLYTAVLPLNTFDSALTAGGGLPPTFGDLVVVPSGAAMFDDEVRIYEAVGQDAGGLVNVAAAVKWSLKLPAGCTGSPAGSLVVNAANASIVTYKPPATGTFVNSCYDQVVASLPNAGIPVSATANAVYFAPSQAISFPGKVVTKAGVPVANAVVDVYGGSGVLGFGDFLALTDSTGSFVRNVPPLRPVIPFVDNITPAGAIPSVAAFSVTPTNIPVGPSGGHPAAVTLTEQGPFTNHYAPLAPAAFSLINSFDVGNAALLDVPFGLPNSAGALPVCSIGAFVTGQSTVTACGSVVKGGGVYGGWAANVSADAVTGGNDFTFLQPAGGSGQQVLSVRTKITSYTDPNGSGVDKTAPTCSSTAACVSYARYFAPGGIGSAVPAPLVPANLPAGTVLQIDGVFSATVQGTTYNVNLIRNVYSGSFQVLGQPQRAHAEAFVYPFGAAKVDFSDNWYNPLDQLGGSFTFNRTQTATGYTLAGKGTQSYFRTGYAPTSISYTLANGVVNLSPGPVTDTYSVTSVNNSSQLTLTVQWNWSGLAAIGSTASGSVNNAAGQAGATFAVAPSGDVTLTESLANGGGVQNFLL